MKKLHFIGIDSWDRPVYQDESGQLWKDVNLGSGIPSLHSATSNDFDGEPDMPISGQFEIIKQELGGINSVAENIFSGRTIVVTGTLEHFTRKSIKAKIEELGAKIGSSVSKNTDYLICGEKAGSKLDKARSLGVTILTEQQFLNMSKTV